MGHDAFDGVAVHPYSYPAAPLDAEPWNSFAALPNLRAELVAEGDGAKSIWLTEYGAPTGDSSRAVSPDDQARFVTEAVDVAGVWSWTGPILLYSYRDAGTDAGDAEDNFGLVDREFSPKPALEALRAELGA